MLKERAINKFKFFNIVAGEAKIIVIISEIVSKLYNGIDIILSLV